MDDVAPLSKTGESMVFYPNYWKASRNDVRSGIDVAMRVARLLVVVVKVVMR